MRNSPGARALCVVVAVAAALVLAGCSRASVRGTLSGHLYMVGGPAVRDSRPAARPIAGQVVAAGRAGTFSATVGPDGAYTLQVPPGSYSVSATSPSYNGGSSTCRVNATLRVAANVERVVDIYCQVR